MGKTTGKKNHQDLRGMKGRAWTAGIIIFLITVFVYFPSLPNEFVDWDDNLYVTRNPHIQEIDFSSIRWMFSSYYASNWHPLTWLSHAIDIAVWGLQPAPHRLTNIFLHGLNTMLVFWLVVFLMLENGGDGLARHRLFDLKTEKSSIALGAGIVTALLFGLHPVHVESVAWISERKDLLSSFFFLLTVLLYLRFAAFHSQARSSRKWYVWSVFCFILALLSKPMAVTLPVILFLLDVYPLKRLNRDIQKSLPVVLEKIPFVLLSAASSLITLLAQKSGGSVAGMEHYALNARITNAFQTMMFYLWKMIWPRELVPLYPLPLEQNPYSLGHVISMVMVACITGFCLWMWRRNKRFWLAAWLYYLMTLLPVLGLVQVGSQAAADRYTYLPSIAPFLLAGLGVIYLLHRLQEKQDKAIWRYLVLGGIALIMAMLSFKTIQQTRVWKDSGTLWNYVMHAFPDTAYMAYNHLGFIHAAQGKLDTAILEYSKAIEIHPYYVECYYNLGIVYTQKGMLNEAMETYKNAIRLEPKNPQVHNNLGIVYAQKGMLQEALASFEKALSLDPYNANVYYNMSRLFYIQKDYASAYQYAVKAKGFGYTVPEDYLKTLR